jgi:predicted dienelactone hydrolase
VLRCNSANVSVIGKARVHDRKRLSEYQAVNIHQLGAYVAIVLLALSSPATAGNVGYQHRFIPDPSGPPLEVGVWYPTAATPSDQDIELFVQTVAPDAPVAGDAHPLVVISHGTGGSFAGHYDTALALAQAGFVVAAVTHTGDNWHDYSRPTQLADRPRQMRVMVDYMLADWPGHATINAGKVGIFGFSSGGFTALAIIGGVPDLSLGGPYCLTHAETFTCRLVKDHPRPPLPLNPWIADPRVKSAVIAAPAVGFAFTHEGLAHVAVPIQLWRADDDHILPAPDYADAVRAALPSPPEFHGVPGADHFDFLAPCSDSLAMRAPQICVDHGFDRAAFHAQFNAAIVAFFRATL